MVSKFDTRFVLNPLVKKNANAGGRRKIDGSKEEERGSHCRHLGWFYRLFVEEEFRVNSSTNHFRSHKYEAAGGGCVVSEGV